MSVQSCRECGGVVSTEASTCPHCGAPEPTRPPAAAMTAVERQPWKPGDPYTPDLIPAGGSGTKGLLGRPRRLGPFRAGDWVRVTSLEHNGYARVLDQSSDWDRGFGTKLHPAWLVEFPDGERRWYNRASLTELTKDERDKLA